MTNINPFNVAYDAGSDVLYIARRSEPAVRGVEDEQGIVWRYDAGGHLIGATILDFQDLWSDKHPALTEQLSRRLGISTPQALDLVEVDMKNRGN